MVHFNYFGEDDVSVLTCCYLLEGSPTRDGLVYFQLACWPIQGTSWSEIYFGNYVGFYIGKSLYLRSFFIAKKSSPENYICIAKIPYRKKRRSTSIGKNLLERNIVLGNGEKGACIQLLKELRDPAHVGSELLTAR